MQDRVATMQWIYPETNLFFLSLISGVIGIFVVVIISLRRPNSANWVKVIWPYTRAMLVVALMFDFCINLIGFFYWQLTSISWLVCQGLIVFALIALCFTSKRMQINLIEFPEALPEK
jgi:hypothetical protein